MKNLLLTTMLSIGITSNAIQYNFIEAKITTYSSGTLKGLDSLRQSVYAKGNVYEASKEGLYTMPLPTIGSHPTTATFTELLPFANTAKPTFDNNGTMYIGTANGIYKSSDYINFSIINNSPTNTYSPIFDSKGNSYVFKNVTKGFELYISTPSNPDTYILDKNAGAGFQKDFPGCAPTLTDAPSIGTMNNHTYLTFGISNYDQVHSQFGYLDITNIHSTQLSAGLYEWYKPVDGSKRNWGMLDTPVFYKNHIYVGGNNLLLTDDPKGFKYGAFDLKQIDPKASYVDSPTFFNGEMYLGGTSGLFSATYNRGDSAISNVKALIRTSDSKIIDSPQFDPYINSLDNPSNLLMVIPEVGNDQIFVDYINLI